MVGAPSLAGSSAGTPDTWQNEQVRIDDCPRLCSVPNWSFRRTSQAGRSQRVNRVIGMIPCG